MVMIGDIMHSKSETIDKLYGKNYEGIFCYSIKIASKDPLGYGIEVLNGCGGKDYKTITELEDYYLVKRNGINFR